MLYEVITIVFARGRIDAADRDIVRPLHLGLHGLLDIAGRDADDLLRAENPAGLRKPRILLAKVDAVVV